MTVSFVSNTFKLRIPICKSDLPIEIVVPPPQPMNSLGNTGIINWVWEFPYDLSWLDAELITHYNSKKKIEPTEDLSLHQPD